MDLDSTILLMSSPDSSSLAIRLVFLGDTACFHLCPHQQRGLDIVVYAAAYRHGLISVKCLRLTIGQDKLMRKWLSNTWNLINSFIEIEILSKILSLTRLDNTRNFLATAYQVHNVLTSVAHNLHEQSIQQLFDSADMVAALSTALAWPFIPLCREYKDADNRWA